jgi:hypothetical protein
MKRNFVILIFLLASTLTSCWQVDEDWSLCEVDSRLVLDFHLDGVPDREFTDYINSVDVYLFDDGLNYLLSRRLPAAALADSLRTSFDLDPGTYHAVCWANVRNNSRTSYENKHILESYVEIVSPATGDPVYYAPYKSPEIHPGSRAEGEQDYTLYAAEVAAGRVTTKNMTFAKVHRTIEVFVEGWEFYSPTGTPKVAREGAGGRYDFLLRADITDFLSFSSTTSLVTIDGKQYHSTLFHSALLPLKEYSGAVRLIDPVTGEAIVLTNSVTGATTDTRVDLAEYVRSQNIKDDSYIPIYYRFEQSVNPDPSGSDVSVSVALPPWSNHDIHW